MLRQDQPQTANRGVRYLWHPYPSRLKQLVVFVDATIIFSTTVLVTLADLIIEPILPADE